jgi:hypothetical protein
MSADSAPRPFTKPPFGTSQDATHATRQYQTHRRLRGLYIFLVFLGFGGALLALSFAVWRWYFAYRHFGPAVVWRWASPALGTSAGLTLVGLFGVFSLWRIRGMTVSVHPNSLVILQGDHRITVPWKDIEEIHTSVMRYGFLTPTQENRVRLALRLKNGRRLRFSDAIEDLPRLSDEIKLHVYPKLFQAKRRAFNQGQELSFGALNISPSHLKLGSRILKWDQLESVKLLEGYLEVQHKIDQNKGGKIRIPARKIPNVDLSLQLLEELIQVERSHRPDAEGEGRESNDIQSG